MSNIKSQKAILCQDSFNLQQKEQKNTYSADPNFSINSLRKYAKSSAFVYDSLIGTASMMFYLNIALIFFSVKALFYLCWS